MVAAVSSLPPPVSPVRTTGGKALFENLYLPPLPLGVKPLNSFASLNSSLQDITAPLDSRAANSRAANSRFVEDVYRRLHLPVNARAQNMLGTLRNHDDDGNGNVKKQ